MSIGLQPDGRAGLRPPGLTPLTEGANGNMLTSNSDTYTYDANNFLVTMTSGGVTTTYLYDGQGNLVKKSASDGTWTVYVGGVYELNKVTDI